MRINTNVNAMNAQTAATATNKNLSSSLEKLSTGLRINKASDDASGMAIADKLRTQASSLGQSISNANSASALIQIADKAMAEQSNILDTVKTKLIQASNSTTSSDGRKAILKDVQKLMTQMDSIASNTNYNGVTLLQASSSDTGASTALSFQVGESSSNTITSTAANSNTTNLGGGADTLTTSAATGVTVDSAGAKQVKAGTSTESIEFGSADTTVSGAADITVSGKISSISGANALSVITLNTTNTEDIAFLDALAGVSTTDGFTTTGTAGEYTMTGEGTDYALDDHEFSALQVSSDNAATGTGNINILSGANAITVTNNSTTTGMVVEGQAGGLTGGDLLSTLKGLNEDSLTAATAQQYMGVVDEALTQLNTTRSDFGSTQNQLESAVRNMSTTQTNIKAAESVIRDVDYASESANFNKQNIIAQAGTYAMSQANSIQQNVLRLLQ